MVGRLKRVGFQLKLVPATVAAPGLPDVFDYSGWRPDLAQLKAAGIVGMQRYLTTQTTGFGPIKKINKPEYDALIAAGFQVLLGFENSNTSWKGENGRSAIETGRIHGAAARQQARILGHPDHRPIAFAVDSGDQLSNVGVATNYIRGCVEGSGTGRQMVYAGTNVIEACWNAGLITGGWKAGARSWSTVFSQHVVLEQLTSKSYPQFPPTAYDENRRFADDWGQWPLSALPPPVSTGPCDCCCV